MLSDRENKSLLELAHDAGTLVSERVGDILIFDTNEVWYISPALESKLKRNEYFHDVDINNYLEVDSLIKSTSYKMAKHGYAACSHSNQPFMHSSICMIAINKNLKNDHCLKNYSYYQYFVDLINHELGHILLKNGDVRGSLGRDHVSETAADVYMALRHKQTFGNNTNFLLHHNNSHQVVAGGKSHYYTDMAIQKVDALARQVDLTLLSPEKTLELADEIEQKYSFKGSDLKNMSRAYSLAGNFYNGSHKITPDACFDVMQLTNEDDVSRAGWSYLNSYKVKNTIDKQLEFWVEVCGYMKKNGVEPNLAKARDLELGASAITPAYVWDMIQGEVFVEIEPQRNLIMQVG